MNTSSTSTAGGKGRMAATAAIVFVVAAIVGAYLDSVWWLNCPGLYVTLAAGAILLVGGIVMQSSSGFWMVRTQTLSEKGSRGL